MIGNVIQGLTVGAAVVAATFFGLKANMLKPENGAWPDRPPSVRLALWGLSVVLGAYVLACLDGYDPAPGELLICAALAVVSLILWRDLHRQTRNQSEG